MSSESKCFYRTEEDQKRSEELHDKFRDELLKRQLSNNENYDKAIITLSSAGLALSLTAINSVIPFSGAQSIWLIKLTWISFLITVAGALSAYVIGNKAIDKQLKIAEDYYINGLVKAQSEKNKYSTVNTWLNIFVGVAFTVAIASMISFVFVNLSGDNIMTGKKTEQTFVALDSASVPKMQAAPGSLGAIKKSAGIPRMQTAPGVASSSEKRKSAPSNASESTKSRE